MKPSVLVIDADENHRLLLRAQLKEEGYAAEAFPDWEAASAFLVRWPGPVAALVYASPPAIPATRILDALGRLAKRFPLLVIASAWQTEAWRALGWPRLTVLRRPVSIGQVVEAVKAVAG